MVVRKVHAAADGPELRGKTHRTGHAECHYKKFNSRHPTCPGRTSKYSSSSGERSETRGSPRDESVLRQATHRRGKAPTGGIRNALHSPLHKDRANIYQMVKFLSQLVIGNIPR
jgi:hypothetical protein